MKNLNFTPRGNNILTTAYIKKVETSFLMSKGYQPTLKDVQQVTAVGPLVDEKTLKVGDWVVLDLDRYKKHVKVKSKIRAGVGGEDMIKEELVLPFFAIPGNDTPFLKMSDREIEGIIDNYDFLPKEVSDYTTMEEFNKMQEELHKEVEKAKEEFDKKSNKNNKKSVGPSVRTDSAKIKMY